MKKLLIAAAIVLSTPAFAQYQSNRDVQVDGHYRQDGQYVQPHHRSAPDNTQYNNYGSQGSSNPYTGQQGTRQPRY